MCNFWLVFNQLDLVPQAAQLKQFFFTPKVAVGGNTVSRHQSKLPPQPVPVPSGKFATHDGTYYLYIQYGIYLAGGYAVVASE
jgi:hypothetical protein